MDMVATPAPATTCPDMDTLGQELIGSGEPARAQRIARS